MKTQYGLFLHNKLQQDELEKVGEFPKPAADAELLVVVGGDGAFLKACHERLPKSKKVLLVKKENSTAFYKAVDLKDVDEKFWERLEKGDYKTTKLPMLEVEVTSNKQQHDAAPERLRNVAVTTRMSASVCGGRETYYAINDVAIRGTTNNRVYEFEVFPEKRDSAKIRSDGMVISTAQASASYNRSADGPVIELGNSYIVTSALAYTCHYSKVFDGKEETRIVAKGRMQIAIDGSNPFMDELECVELKVKLSDKFVNLVTFEEFSVLERAKSLIP